MSDRILVTGGAGFSGGHRVDALLAGNWWKRSRFVI